IAKNKYTLIDFWASWCGPCRREMPNVIAAYKEYNKKGFGIVGVSLDNDADKWKAAIKEMGMTWDHMSDVKGWQGEGAALYGVNSIPATVLVAQDGTIIERNLRGEAIKEKLSEILNYSLYLIIYKGCKLDLQPFLGNWMFINLFPSTFLINFNQE
ncbi:MAG: TlpA family protein disulfide reductase, partial [Bacteroides sp.]|nr:TlpA family protein disulfide reductase [Bacteroides sp.]